MCTITYKRVLAKNRHKSRQDQLKGSGSLQNTPLSSSNNTPTVTPSVPSSDKSKHHHDRHRSKDKDKHHHHHRSGHHHHRDKHRKREHSGHKKEEEPNLDAKKADDGSKGFDSKLFCFFIFTPPSLQEQRKWRELIQKAKIGQDCC
jgi:hypothetical protein